MKGINLVPVLLYSPKWLAPRFNFPPEEISAFSNFVKRVVSRYHHFIKHWEVWNEANSYYFWVGDTGQYSSILAAASRSAKDVDPEAKILFCGLADPATPDLSFLFNVLRNVEEKCLDVINLHAYPGTWNRRKIEEWPSMLKTLVDRLGKSGVRKPIWITETGLSSQENNSKMRETMQASYLVRAFSSLLGSGEVQKVFWYRLKDEKRASDTEERFGLLVQNTMAEGSKLINRAYYKLARTLPLSVGSLGSKFFRDRRKLSFRSYTEFVQLLSNNFESDSSEFGNGSATVSFLTSKRSVKIHWKEGSTDFPRASILGYDSKKSSSAIFNPKIGKFLPTIISSVADKNQNQREG